MILNLGRLFIFVVDEVPSKTAGSNSKNKKTPIAQQEQVGSTICFSCLTQEILDKETNKKETTQTKNKHQGKTIEQILNQWRNIQIN